jgi:uncharacterized protein
MSDALWLAFGLVLVFEGLMPLLVPQAWRRMFTEVLRLRDGQLRFFGLLSVATGHGRCVGLRLRPRRASARSGEPAPHPGRIRF